MDEIGPRKRGSTLPLYDDNSYVPDFLQDSPFLPVGPRWDDTPRTPYIPPTIRQVLRSRNIRRTFTITVAFVTGLLLLRYGRRAINALWYSGPACLASQTFVPSPSYLHDESIVWTGYAYAQYATDAEYLCNSVMIFEALQRLGSKADRLLMYSEAWDQDPGSPENRLLMKAKNDYGVKLMPVEVQHKNTAYYRWSDSFTKLLAFEQTQYKRLVILDSDGTILKPMDELFFIPATPAAMPRAYWLPYSLTSHIMLITPSSTTFSLVQDAISAASGSIYDMEIVNSLFGDTCILLPHRWYGLLTGEFRRQYHDHRQFLEENERWDPMGVLREAKYVHFSDDPLPKPWEHMSGKTMENMKPRCVGHPGENQDCRARDIWLELYRDFGERRKAICTLDTPLQPE